MPEQPKPVFDAQNNYELTFNSRPCLLEEVPLPSHSRKSSNSPESPNRHRVPCHLTVVSETKTESKKIDFQKRKALLEI